MARRVLNIFSLLLVTKLLLYFAVIVQCTQEEICETLPTEIHLTKEEYDELGRLVRSCSGEVNVNKCEGMCSSQVQPSVVTSTGFIKDCYCCRENFLRERLVTLTHCYDPDGLRLNDEERAIMEIRLREPSECKCFKCGDYNR